MDNVHAMGILCSVGDREVAPQSQAQTYRPEALEAVNAEGIQKPQMPWRPAHSASHWREALDRGLDSQDAYERARKDLQLEERKRAFDAKVDSDSSNIERQATSIVKKLKTYDWERTFGSDSAESCTGKKIEEYHFLGSVDLINQTEMIKVAKMMPKGAHLHIHFNSCLPAEFLIRQARHMDAMYIKSTHPLTSQENETNTRISFMVMTPHEATLMRPLGHLWDDNYVQNTWMPYKQFLKEFSRQDGNGTVYHGIEAAENWLISKMHISEEEAHGSHGSGLE